MITLHFSYFVNPGHLSLKNYTGVYSNKTPNQLNSYYQLIFSITDLIFVRKTSFRLISVKASSGLRKMFSQCYYNQNGVWENVHLTILDTHFPFCFDVITELWQRFCCHFWVILEYLVDLAQLKMLADVIANIMVDVVTIYLILWQMLLPYWSFW